MPALTAVYAGLITALEGSAAFSAIFDQRIYQAWPAGSVTQPVAVLWETSGDLVTFDQGPVKARDLSIGLELAGRSPDVLKNGEDAVADLLGSTAVTASGWRSVWARVLSSRADFNTDTRLHRRLLTVRVTAQPG